MWESYVFWALVLTVADIVLAGGVTIHAVLNKRDSRSVIGWVGLAWLAPFVGAIAYLILGINRIQRKALSLELHDSWNADQRPQLNAEQRHQVESYAREYPNLSGLVTAGLNLTGAPLVPGNSVEPLIDGDRARDQFLEALLAAQNRCVRIRVLIDDLGSKYSRPNMLRRMKDAGLKSAGFLPFDHTKLMMVDGV
jgi:cardiolipin synthase